MSIEFKINGKAATSEDLQKMNQQSPKNLEDQRDLAMGLGALKRIKEMKGEKMSDFLERQHESVKGRLGEEGIKTLEQNDESKELNEALDMLEETKRRKREEQEKKKSKEGEQTKTCSNCGYEGSLDANFCGACGKKFEVEKTKACQSCGKEGLIKDNFCRWCGNKFEEIQVDDQKKLDEARDKISKL